MLIRSTELANRSMRRMARRSASITIGYIRPDVVNISLQGNEDVAFNCSAALAARILVAAGFAQNPSAESQITCLSDGALVYSRNLIGTGMYRPPSPVVSP